jgi:hypothetical protein
MSKSISLALRVDFNLLPWSCKVGGAIFGWFCHMFPFIGEEAPVGVMGGVETEGKTDGELRESGLNDPMSIEAPAEYDRGEGTAEPVEAYKGRSSSVL